MVVRDEVEQIYVAAEHRGRGVAQRLLDAAEQHIAKHGFGQAWLAVVASNSRARAFYTRAGWIDNGLFDYQAFGDAGRSPWKWLALRVHWRWTKEQETVTSGH
jgi:ribosomal protein S18 acetylase RimI-like enzyme